MGDAHNFDALGNDAIQNQVIGQRVVTQAVVNVVTRRTQLRMVGEQFALRFDSIE